MWVKLILIVCGFSEINSLIYPIVDPNKLYKYSPPENDVTFHLYHRNDLSINDQIFIGNESSIALSRFDTELPTKIIVHGWTHGKDIPWIVEMREVLAETGMWNVIVVDWSNLSHVVYVEARIHNFVVGKQLSKFLLFLMDYGNISMMSVHLIGHSMGAQISAVAGLLVEMYSGEKIGRITGLDPAAPLFEWPHIESLDEVLDPSDAEFVDVIHTNARHLGMVTPAGHVDYYPNGGEMQIHCLFWACSHLKSCEFFIASIRKPDMFKAVSFQSWKEYMDGKRDHLDAYPMGIAANSDIPSGIYFVETTDEYMKYITSRTTFVDSKFQ
nr:pancreatic lipase-related protein 2-like [Leptinotarsa decemlineata]